MYCTGWHFSKKAIFVRWCDTPITVVRLSVYINLLDGVAALTQQPPWHAAKIMTSLLCCLCPLLYLLQSKYLVAYPKEWIFCLHSRELLVLCNIYWWHFNFSGNSSVFHVSLPVVYWWFWIQNRALSPKTALLYKQWKVWTGGSTNFHGVENRCVFISRWQGRRWKGHELERNKKSCSTCGWPNLLNTHHCVLAWAHAKTGCGLYSTHFLTDISIPLFQRKKMLAHPKGGVIFQNSSFVSNI